jgi:hypothetical protein
MPAPILNAGFHCQTARMAPITPPKWLSFSPPPSHDSYSKAFDRLLRDLETEQKASAGA